MDHEQAIVELQKQMAAAEEQHKTLFRRIDKAEKLTESVHALALSIQALTDNLNNTNATVSSLCDDMDDLKAKPAKKWETVTADIIKIVVAALVGFALAKVGLG